MPITPTLRLRFLAQPVLALSWQLVWIFSGLAVVLLFALLTLTERLVVSPAERAAQAKADELAGSLAALYAQAMERHLSELKMIAHSAALTDLGNARALRTELQRLSALAPSYRSLVVLDPAARVLGSTQTAPPPGTVLPNLLPQPLPAAPWFNDHHKVGSSPLGAGSVHLGVPFDDAVGQLLGFVLAELDLKGLRTLGDEIVARPNNTTVLTVALFDRGGQPLINDHPELDAQALQAYLARPEGDLVGHLHQAPGGKQVLVSHSSLPPTGDGGGLGWQVVVALDLDAALAPVKRQQRAVMFSGSGLAALFALLVYGLLRPAVAPAARQAGPAGLQSPEVDVDGLALVAADAAQLKLLLDLLPIGLVVLDGELRVRFCNRHTETILDMQAAEMVGLNLWQAMGRHMSPEQVAQSRLCLQERTAPYTFTLEHQRRDATGFRCEWVVSTERDADGQLMRALALVHDVTEQRAADELKAGQARDISALARQLLDHESQITQKLAQVLHDRLGQTLTALRLAFDALETQAARGLCAGAWSAGPMGSLLDQAVRDVREALVELHPPLLDEQGLHATLDNEIRNLWRQPTGVRITLSNDDETTGQRYPVEVEYAAFMVAREAISNALQHAQPHHISVNLSGRAGALQVEIKDDGSGFEAATAQPPPGHLGLVGMRGRALAVGATLSVLSLPGLGSCVRFAWLEPSHAQAQDQP